MAKYIQSLALLRNCLFVGLLLTLLIDSEKASAQFQELKSEKVTPVTFTADIFQSGESPLKTLIALTFQNEKKCRENHATQSENDLKRLKNDPKMFQKQSAQ